MGAFDKAADDLVAAPPPPVPEAKRGMFDDAADQLVASDAKTAAARRAQVRGEQNIFSNLVDDVKDLPTNVLRAGKAYGEAAAQDIGVAVDDYKKGYDEGGIPGAIARGTILNPERRKVLTDTVLPVAADLLRANVESIAHTVRHPLTAIHDEPLMSAANIASLGSVGGAVANVVKNAGRFGKLDLLREVAQAVSPVPLPSIRRSPLETVEKLRPSTAPAAAAKLVSKVSPGIAAWMLDPTATISPGALAALRNMQDMEPVLQSKVVEALRGHLDGLDEGQRSQLRDLLAAEDARRVLPDLPARVQKMQAHLRAPAPQLEASTAKDLIVRPYTDDSYIGDFLQVDNALKRRAVTFVDKTTGKDLGGLEAMLGDKPNVDPANIDIKINPNHPLAPVAEGLKDRLLGVRQTLAQLAKDANDVNVGEVVRGGKVLENQKLLPDAAFARHLATYMPDVIKSEVATPGLAGQLREVADTLPATSASPFAAAHFKHEKVFEDRVLNGATSDVQYALSASASAAVHETMKYKLFDTLASNHYHTWGDKTEVLTKDRYDLGVRDGTVKPGEWVRASTDIDEATGLSKFGALSGRYVSKPVYTYLTSVNRLVDDAGITTRGIWKFLRRFRNAFASSKVIGNLPSHINNVIGNVMHQMVDGGMLGVSDYGRELGKCVGRGYAGSKTGDKFFRAAADIGLVNSHTVKELDDVVAHTMRQDGFWPGIKRGVESLLETAAKAKAAPAATAKAVGIGAAKAATSPLRVYEYLARDNALLQGMGKLFSGVENANRLSIFRRFIEKWAQDYGMTVDEALAEPDVLRRAKARVERYAYRYDNVPLALQVGDQHGVALFSRYAWKSVFGLLDAVVIDNPGVFRTAQGASDEAYDASNTADRKLLDHQPPFAKGRVVPVGKHKTLSMTYWTPYSTPAEMVGIKPKGTYDAGYFREQSVFDPTSGPLASALQIFRGEDPQTGKPIEDRPGKAIRNGKLASMFDLLTPGQAYHVTEKLLPALKAAAGGPPAIDKRGRELTLSDAVLQNLGIRTEVRRDGKVEQGIVKSYKQRVMQVHQLYDEKMRKERDPVRREAIAKERDAVLADTKDQLKKLLR